MLNYMHNQSVLRTHKASCPFSLGLPKRLPKWPPECGGVQEDIRQLLSIR